MDQNNKNRTPHQNTIATVLQAAGVIVLIVAIVYSFYMAFSRHGFASIDSVVVFLSTAFDGLVVGLLFLALAEIIRLLTKIANK